MTSFLEFLGGYDFINEKYPIRNRAELPHLRSFLNKELSADAQLTEQSFYCVFQKNPAWMQNQKKRILSDDPSESIGALGEMRAYADLLDMGFDVIPNGTNKGADFILQHSKSKEKAFVEVATKTLPVANISPDPYLVSATQETAVFEIAYFGFPKEGENTTENAVSKIASTKGDSLQASTSVPSILFIDFQNLPLNGSMMISAFPFFSFQGAFDTGALWAAFYGERGVPLYEEVRIGTPDREPIKMRHSGKFAKGNSSKFSGAFCSFSSFREGLCFFENPENEITPNWIKVHMICNQRFSIQHSCFKYGNTALREHIDLRNQQIFDFGKMYNDLNMY